MDLDVRRPPVILGLLAVFVVTRGIALALALSPGIYGEPDPTSDVLVYEEWGVAVQTDRAAPYGEVAIEYPPGAIPFLVLPATVQNGDSYEVWFALLMVAVDLVGLGALWVMTLRGASARALLAWLLVPPLLGPVLYSRFDLVPAVALLLAFERAQVGRWFGTGGWLAFGTAAKVFPVFALPAALVCSTRRRPLLLGFGLVAVLMLIPYAGVPRALTESVVGYHAERGVQVESLWGALVLLGDHLGFESGVGFQFGAMEVWGDAVPAFRVLSNLLALGALAGSTAVAWRWARRGSLGDLSLVVFGTLALLTGVGRVYSPQFVIWLVAAGVLAVAFAGPRARPPFGVLVAVVALTAWIFPTLFVPITSNELWAVLVLLVRDLLTIAVGVLALGAVAGWPRGRPEHDPEPRVAAGDRSAGARADLG